jgi:hypothetical protein
MVQIQDYGFLRSGCNTASSSSFWEGMHVVISSFDTFLATSYSSGLPVDSGDVKLGGSAQVVAIED